MKKENKIIYVDFSLTKKRIKSKNLMFFYKFISSLIKKLPLPSFRSKSKRFYDSNNRKTSNY